MSGYLGSKEIFANLTQAIYVNDNTKASIVTVNLLNRNTVAARVSIAVSSSQTSPANYEWVEYNSSVDPTATLERSALIVNPGQYVVIRSDTSYISASCWGITSGTTVSVTPITTQLGSTPIWTTSTTLDDVGGGAYAAIQLQATDSDVGQVIDYSLTSGTLPTGLSLSSTGLLSGTPSAVGYVPNDTTLSTFTVSATDGISVVPRTFSITKKWFDGTTAALAAPTAASIKTITSTTTNGYYWIKPAGTSTAYQVHCDMANSGGGWMLMSFCGVNITNGAHVEDAYTGAAFNMGTTATSITSTNQSSGTAGNMGQTFINALAIAGRDRGMAVFRIEDAGTTWTNWYIPLNSTSGWLPVAQRKADAGSPNNSASQWLKSSYPSYTADAGHNGAGTESGTANEYAGSNWGTAPYNMNSTSSSNWGYSISPTYSGGGYSTYNSAHSSGWNRRASFWLKIV
jgi:hypothetical protein